ncbi:hypothetical protein AWB80_08289 [Caballeronia pedi]|uniref:DUF1843 domain-containing protein n=1 Tax=Caballeronia pedi TaxID=1777141 RepID=A0A158E875_9BURK|nr:DUF1843 domain-containing protein [Caballeronia pedi]SAL02147.1 hypothetical protein AWB80_08289 [Caballeronia pedi]
MAAPMPLYGVAINEAIHRGNLEEMRELATVTGYMLRVRSQDLEGDEEAELTAANKQLVSAIAERTAIKLAREDIVAVRDGFVLIDSVELARGLNLLLNSDTEGPYIRLEIGWS